MDRLQREEQLFRVDNNGMQQPKKKSSRSTRAVLVFLNEDAGQDAVKLRRDATIIGRDKGDVVIADKEISATHCQIQNIGEDFHIFDMNSTNGTFVNGKRIIKARLRSGDRITIGKTVFRFDLMDEAKVRHISTVYKPNRTDNPGASIVETLAGKDLQSGLLRLVIEINYLDGTQETVSLDQRIVYVGRASSFGRFEDDPEMSRRHLLLKVNDTGEIFMEDQSSTNGSYLNGQRINGLHPVRPRDEIRVGTSKLRVYLQRKAITKPT